MNSFPTSMNELAELLPKEVFQTSTKKAIFSLVKTITFVTLGIVTLAYTPWYLLPIGWMFLGTAITGVSTVAQ
jgi:fatty acid desaturase